MSRVAEQGGTNRPKMARAVQDRIGRELRAMYEELLKQPLPEDLIAPLRAPTQLQAPLERLQAVMSDIRGGSPGPGQAPSPNTQPSTPLPGPLPEAKSA
jgi:Anti-sigma factor NepR